MGSDGSFKDWYALTGVICGKKRIFREFIVKSRTRLHQERKEPDGNDEHHTEEENLLGVHKKCVEAGAYPASATAPGRLNRQEKKKGDIAKTFVGRGEKLEVMATPKGGGKKRHSYLDISHVYPDTAGADGGRKNQLQILTTRQGKGILQGRCRRALQLSPTKPPHTKKKTHNKKHQTKKKNGHQHTKQRRGGNDSRVYGGATRAKFHGPTLRTKSTREGRQSCGISIRKGLVVRLIKDRPRQKSLDS